MKFEPQLTESLFQALPAAEQIDKKTNLSKNTFNVIANTAGSFEFECHLQQPFVKHLTQDSVRYTYQFQNLQYKCFVCLC